MPARASRTANWASDALRSTPYGSKVVRIAELSIEMLGDPDDCPDYLSAMTEAVADDTPPFDAEAYAGLYVRSARQDRWMATSLISNAEREGDGSRRLWSLAAFADDQERGQLKRHAVDESKHALMYLALLDLAFPGAATPAFRAELRQLSPGFSMRRTLRPVPGSPYAKPPSLDDFVQMNIAEIRTTIHHMLQRDALAAHAPRANMPTIRGIQDCLLRDELAHVGYTARIVERRTREAGAARLGGLVRRRLSDFSRITREELGDNAFDCSLACCAKRDWCRARKGGEGQPAFHDG